ncbi:hypothetical protein Poly51_25770 [Rubripirellula tenax]|uniref:Xylosidase/arabinosidase n=1 Tax=Rubripirellula tenax TaxID=2528015 RepID=A0A5C6F7V8_9BACT|nr:glycoside hydrolase family 71/99-like protein [Rubripirellula tenax]TWU56660.1 hypothetical protein Poly51_25770 [Rubripirellula tenax]
MRNLCVLLLLLVSTRGGGVIADESQPPPATPLPTTPRSDGVIDPTTLDGKVICGYQGWFNCDGDGAELGWTHWAKNRNRPLAPGNVSVDLWPDVSELEPEARYATDFLHTDGSSAEVFSSGDRSTVMRHFQWMKQYGIDGVMIQRFANGLADPKLRRHKDNVLAHARKAAAANGRGIAVMYDLSGLHRGAVKRVREDWQRLQETRLTADPMYFHHRGGPVVAIWGIGFSDDRDYSIEECMSLVKWLKSQGCTVMLGVPSFWREGTRDATSDPRLHAIIELADIISPWTVGRYRSPSEATKHATAVWQSDLKWCVERELDLMPVVFPGFSWHNLTGQSLDSIPRLKGKFLWSQVVAANRIKCRMIYVAMFDEVDEGTAIFKCTDDPPTQNGGKFLATEGLPSDHYLKVVGRAGQLFRNEIVIEKQTP